VNSDTVNDAPRIARRLSSAGDTPGATGAGSLVAAAPGAAMPACATACANACGVATQRSAAHASNPAAARAATPAASVGTLFVVGRAVDRLEHRFP
jgi:hypothetical protein